MASDVKKIVVVGGGFGFFEWTNSQCYDSAHDRSVRVSFDHLFTHYHLISSIKYFSATFRSLLLALQVKKAG